MKRRDFIRLLGGAATWPLMARAQQRPTMLRLGIVTIQPRKSPPYVALDHRLSELGYVEGQNFAVEFLDPVALVGGFDEAMKELVRRKVDVIVASVESALKSALAATNTVPIVMVAIDYDPLVKGYVTSLARPSRNVTGIYFQQVELAKKRLQVMMDAVPGIQTAVVFWDEASADQWHATQSAGTTLGLRLMGSELRERPYDYERALNQVALDHRGAVVVMTSANFFFDRARLADFMLRHRLPAMFALREWPEAGGLMSYGPSITGLYRRVADYVDRIARGVKPTELPVEQPTKFELVINLKTAQALGLTTSRDLLLLADEVIE